MSEPAVAVKGAAKTAAVGAAKPEVAAKPEQKMRDVQPKRFSASALQTVGYGDYNILMIQAPRGMSYDDMLKPEAWTNVVNVVAKDQMNTRNQRDSVGSIIRVDAEDGTYHAELRIMRVIRDIRANPVGIEVKCIGPSIDLKTGEARPIDLRTGKAWIDPVKAEEN